LDFVTFSDSFIHISGDLRAEIGRKGVFFRVFGTLLRRKMKLICDYGALFVVRRSLKVGKKKWQRQ
jgi:hypothetical protein